MKIEMGSVRTPVFDLMQEERKSWWGGRLVSGENFKQFDGLSAKAKEYFELTFIDDHDIGGAELSEIQVGVSRQFDVYKDKVEPNEFVEALKQLLKCKEVTSIDLAHCVSEDGQSFSGCEYGDLFVKNCSEILENGAHIKRIRLAFDINDVSIKVITESCPNLTHINLPWCYKMTSAGLISVVKNCRAVMNLNVGSLHLVDSIGMRALSESSQTLTTVDMSLFCKSDVSQEIADFLSTHPKLTSLSLYYEKLNPVVITPLAGCKELVHLKIRKSPIYENLITAEHLRQVVRGCLKLKHLDLGGRSISEDLLNDIGTHLRDLDYLDVSGGNRPVREAGVIYIKKNCRQLKVFKEPPLWITVWKNLLKVLSKND